MELIQSLLDIIVGLLGSLLPVLNVPDSFIKVLDSAISFLIEIFQIASFLLPLDILVMCFGLILLVDNFALMSRVTQYIVRIIRG